MYLLPKDMLKPSTQHLLELLNNASIGQFTYYPNSGKIEIDFVLEEELGYSPEELDNISKYLSIVDAPVSNKLGQAIKSIEEGKESSMRFDHTILDKHGKKANVESYWFRNESGSITVYNQFQYGNLNNATVSAEFEKELIEAKERAEKNEERYKGLLENVEIGVVVHASDTSIIINNRRSEELLGLTADQMRGKVAIDSYWNFIYEDGSIIPVEDYPVMRVLGNRKAQKNQVVGVKIPEHPIIWLLVNGFPVFNENGGIEEVIISFVDISERKKAEQEVINAKEKAEEIKNRLLLASKSANLAIWDWDIVNDVLIWDDRMYELYELSKEKGENTFSDWERKVHPEDRKKAVQEVNDAIEKDKEFNTSFRLLHDDGRIVYIKSNGLIVRDQDGNALRMIGVNRDITATKQNEIALRLAKERAERKEQELAESQKIAKVGSWYLDLASNEVSWSIELYKMYGFDPNKEVPPYTEHMKLFTEESWNTLSAELEKTRQTGVPYELELEMRLEGDQTGWMWVKGEAVKNSEGEIVGLRGVAQDITERKNLAYSLAIAEKSDQIKTAFLHNVSHEIRTPLNAISGFTEMLKQDKLSKEKQKSYISIIQNSSDQLISIISDILTVSTLETGKERVVRKKVNVNEMLIELNSFFNNSALDKKIKLNLHKGLPDESSIIETDETKLRQIMTNLLTNAFKFTHKGSIDFGYDLKGEDLIFYVKDTGIGIKKENHKKIFERFNQADPSIPVTYGGTGLGLSISKDYVELLGGKMSLDSLEGQGSTFYFSIPYQAASNAEEDYSIEEITDPIDVLMAEDQILNFMVIEGLLKDFPVNLIHAKNGKIAVEKIKKNPNIKLVLMDIKMPIMSGDEAARIIKSMHPSIRIIAQTGYAMEIENKEYQKVFDDFITKPIDYEQLIRKILKHANQA